MSVLYAREEPYVYNAIGYICSRNINIKAPRDFVGAMGKPMALGPWSGLNGKEEPYYFKTI